jgi:hypothetical protein
MDSGTIIFSDGMWVKWTVVEHVPYSPACYQHDEGYIVESSTGTPYFISSMTGIVYGEADNADPDSLDWLTREIEGAYSPEMREYIKDMDRMFASMEEDAA